MTKARSWALQHLRIGFRRDNYGLTTTTVVKLTRLKSPPNAIPLVWWDDGSVKINSRLVFLDNRILEAIQPSAKRNLKM